MTTIEREAVAAICLMAAFADGTQNDQERERLRGALQELGDVSDAVFQRVVTGRTTLAEEAGKINSAGARAQAYEFAVGICNADGTTTPAEARFLSELANALNLTGEEAKAATREAEEFAKIPLDDAGPATAAGAGVAAVAAAASGKSTDPAIAKQVDDAIMKHAAIAAGIELLPQTLAGVAVVPLQTRLVYQIGKMYGYTLDGGHVKEFLAVAGAGITGQFVERHLRRVLGKLAVTVLGKTGRKLVERTTGPAMSFATTYALGQAAKAYYAGGRKLEMSAVRNIFSKSVEEAKNIYAKSEGAIKSQAGKLSPRSILEMVNGS